MHTAPVKLPAMPAGVARRTGAFERH
jgi:hypothetical protein